MKIPQKLTAAATIALAIFAGAAQAAYGTDQVPKTLPTVLAAAEAPCVVTGYSWHAQQGMAARKITSDEVENLVHFNCGSAKWQGPPYNSWLFLGKRIGVTTNDYGYVITVFLR